MTTKAKDNLRSFFSQSRELDARRARGDLDNLNYQIAFNRAKDQLAETNWDGHTARQMALALLHTTCGLSASEREALTLLQTTDSEGWRDWQRASKDKNLERISLAILDLMESVDHPPVPAPSSAPRSAPRTPLPSATLVKASQG
jgi:hypothetical protein